MRLILAAMCLVLLVGTIIAQEPNITGFYAGNMSCFGVNQESVSIKLVDRPDNSLEVTFVTGSIGWYSSAHNINMTGTLRSISDDIQLASPKLKYKLSLNASAYKKQLRLQFAGRCEPFYLVRDSERSKDLQKERKGLERAGGRISIGELTSLYGFWVMDSRRDEEYTLSLDKSGVYLQKLAGDDNAVALELEAVDAKPGDSRGYTFHPAASSFESADFEKVGIIYAAPNSAYGSASESLLLKFLDARGNWSSEIKLKRPRSPSAETRVYESDIFAYQDWQRKFDGYFLVDDEEAAKRLKKTIDDLYERDGWRCLAQTPLTITAGQTKGVGFEEQGVSRLYLIYSPYGSAGLVYRSPAGRLYPSEYDYPLFITSHPTLFVTNVSFAFQLRPVIDRTAVSYQQVPVTIFHFGRTAGDYGTGCQYYADKERSDNFRNRVIAKLLLVFALEYGRRVSNEAKADLPQLATTAARDAFIESLLHDLLPDTTEEELGYLGRWTRLIMSGDFRPQSYVRDAIRESIIQRVAKEKPQYKLDARVLDLLMELALTRRGW